MTALVDLRGSGPRDGLAADAEGFGPEDVGASDSLDGLSLSELLGEVFLPAVSRDRPVAPDASERA